MSIPLSPHGCWNVGQRADRRRVLRFSPTSWVELAGMSLVTLSYSGRVLSLKNMSASAPGSPNHFTYER